MSITVDARGLSCPQPVIMTMAKIKEMGTGEFTVLVDTDTSKENVSRAASSKGWDVRDVQPDGDGYRITLKKG
ncbi:MAG TPA: sulfurtransferase TusA family protein [Deltaproteobacteria bacterium]|jgi:TusA-related sulfurtransferase|nr:sulfurtransferase TusA family protein [Deltaproteobacteria bacterium]HRW79961.1 sulfurtransferase TusA family protein [Desulfomonilia bacterium]NMD40075.1 preprotein translocase subunit TatB [Deltaproteobacteria bacterium]HNQ84640.1 sulfurtransferase TusA family protein [Deltaproteobacteria bacterium]HNS88530.1 sulfurtransferase TusA family protein [Deltaproteobacteria bacterium]